MSSIRFKCHKCGKKLKSHISSIGRMGICPGCNTKNVVPEYEEDLIAEVVKLISADDSGISKDWVVK